MKTLILFFMAFFLAINPANAGKRQAAPQQHRDAKKKKLSHHDEECVVEDADAKSLARIHVIVIDSTTTLPTSFLTGKDNVPFPVYSPTRHDQKYLVNQAITMLVQIDELTDFFTFIHDDRDSFNDFVELVHDEIIRPIVPTKHHRAWFPDQKAFRYTVIDAVALAYQRLLKPYNPCENPSLVEGQRPATLGMIRDLPSSFRDDRNTQHVVKAHELHKKLHAIHAHHAQIFEPLEKAMAR